MSTFIERLFTEKNELDEKISKLSDFTKTEAFDSITAVQKSLLNIQLNSMQTYQKCLEERLIWLSSQISDIKE